MRRFRGSFNIYPNRDITLETSRCLLKTMGAKGSLERAERLDLEIIRKQFRSI
jgi:hypothetical protein